jgi:nucleoid-associated protein YgaU
MGLLDFVKEAGEDLLGRAKAATGHIDPEGIVKSIQGHGLSIENLDVSVEDDVATICGTAECQADREKALLIAGNTRGIARVDDQIQVKAAEPEATFYTVQKGDTLSKIAKAEYGDFQKYPVIFEANRPMLKDPDKIYPGQVLRIPPLDEA